MNSSWTGCMSALGVLKQLGHFAPVWSWLLWTRPSLKHSAAWKSLLDIFCVHEYLGSKVVHLFRQNKSPSQKNTTVIFTHVILCTCVVLGLEREEERETERVLCVQSFPSQSRNNFRWRRVRERQISHDIVYLWHLKKWTYLQNRLTENELTVTGGDSVRGRLDWKFGTDIYTRL